MMRMVMWDFYMAGVSGTWYDCDTAWDAISIDVTPIGYTFVQHLSEFWSEVDYYKMQPHDDLITFEKDVIGHCLANENEYVVHVRANKPFQLKFLDTNLTFNSQTSKVYPGKWFDPSNGNKIDIKSVNETHIHFTPPSSFKEDVVLHLLRR